MGELKTENFELKQKVDALTLREEGWLEQIRLLRRCLLPLEMAFAEAEMVGEPIADDAVVLHFMGSGASDQVTAGEIRKALQP